MQRFIGNGTSLAMGVVLWMAGVCAAQIPEMPKPAKEHELLKQFAGEWEVAAEALAAPGQEALKCEGTESAKMLGGFWLVGQNQASMQGMPVSSVLTIGYDPAAKRYVGTFVCSMDSTHWKYVGDMDESGKKLTLETEGPSMLDHAKKAKYRETLELKDKDHKVFTSFIQDAEGKWVKMITMDYRRKK